MIQFPVFLIQTKADAIHGVENSTFTFCDKGVHVFSSRSNAQEVIDLRNIDEHVQILQVNSLEYLEFVFSRQNNPYILFDGIDRFRLSSLFQ